MLCGLSDDIKIILLIIKPDTLPFSARLQIKHSQQLVDKIINPRAGVLERKMGRLFFLSSSFISCNAPRNKGKQSKTEDTTFIPPAKSGLNPPVLWFCVAKSKVIWDACISSVFIMRPVYHYFTQGCGACLHLIPRLLNSQRAVYSGIQKKASWWHPRAVARITSKP